jgi:hypothetical protein
MLLCSRLLMCLRLLLRVQPAIWRIFIPSQHLKKAKTLNAKLPVSLKSFLPSRFLMELREKNKTERAQDKLENPEIFAVEEAAGAQFGVWGTLKLSIPVNSDISTQAPSLQAESRT